MLFQYEHHDHHTSLLGFPYSLNPWRKVEEITIDTKIKGFKEDISMEIRDLGLKEVEALMEITVEGLT